MEEYQHIGGSNGPARGIQAPDGPKGEQRVTESFTGKGVPGRYECFTCDGPHLRRTERSKVLKYNEQLLGGLPIHINSGEINSPMSGGPSLTAGPMSCSVVEISRDGCYGHHDTLNLIGPWTAESEQVLHLRPSAACNADYIQAITRPFDYVMSLLGKNVRSQLLSALNVWLQVDEKSYNIIDKVIVMLHNASLL